MSKENIKFQENMKKLELNNGQKNCVRFSYISYKIKISILIKKIKPFQVTSNLTWKKNRNIYAKLLLENVMEGILYPPFNKMPPDGHLAKFDKYDIVKITIKKFSIKKFKALDKIFDETLK